MIHHTFLRSLIRRLGLRSLLLPLLSRIEEHRLRHLGHYVSKATAEDTVEITGFNKTISLENLTPEHLELALSHHERPTMTAVLSRVPEGGVAWDVGANTGFYTRFMSAVAGGSGSVFAFEPNSSTFADLRQNLDGFKNVTLLCLGLSDKDGVAAFAAPTEHSSAGRVVSSASEPAGSIATITTNRGDTLIQNHGWPVPVFIKVDVEGHELHVLQGMKDLLSNKACMCVLVEVHFSLLAASGEPHAPSEIQSLLSTCGLARQKWIARSHLLAERA